MGFAAAEEPSAPPAPGDVILIDSFGHPVAVPPAKLPKSLLPPPHVGIEQQVPQPKAGSRLPPALLQRMDSGRKRVFTLFPASPPALASSTLRLQPDFQLVWNPTFNPDPGPFTVVQTQLILGW